MSFTRLATALLATLCFGAGSAAAAGFTEFEDRPAKDPTNTEDDLAIIAGKLGYKADDHGNTIGAGTALDRRGRCAWSRDSTRPR